MKRNNFNYRMAVIAMALLAVLATGCKKEKMSAMRLGISTERFQNNSKVSFDPTNPSVDNQWVGGEPLMINGETGYYVAADEVTPEGTPVYYVTTSALPSGWDDNAVVYTDFIFHDGLYPGSSFDGNLIDIYGTEMEIENLVVDFFTDGPGMMKQKMAFPMVSTSTDGDSVVLFKHLTGALKLTLGSEADTAVSLASLKVVAWGTDATTANHSYAGYTARWAQQMPLLPGAHVGDIPDDMHVNYSSEMHFTFRTDGVAGAAVPSHGNMTFCIPITLNTVSYLTITGYDAAGHEVFSKTANLRSSAHENGVQILRNNIYAVRSIPINTTDTRE